MMGSMTNQEAANLARSVAYLASDIEGEVLFTRFSDDAVCGPNETAKIATLIRHVAVSYPVEVSVENTHGEYGGRFVVVELADCHCGVKARLLDTQAKDVARRIGEVADQADRSTYDRQPAWPAGTLQWAFADGGPARRRGDMYAWYYEERRFQGWVDEVHIADRYLSIEDILATDWEPCSDERQGSG